MAMKERDQPAVSGPCSRSDQGVEGVRRDYQLSMWRRVKVRVRVENRHPDTKMNAPHIYMCRPHTRIYVGFSCVAIYECDFVLAILTCDSCLRFMAAIHRRDLYVRFVSVLCIRDWKMRFVLAICRCDSKMRFVRALSSCDFMTVILSAIHENDVRLTCYDK